MAVAHRVYAWMSSCPEKGMMSWKGAADVRDELFIASLLLSVMHSNMRWPVSTEVSATDATPSAGGAVRATVTPELAQALYKSTEYKGCHVRLDGPTAAQNKLVQEDPWRPSLYAHSPGSCAAHTSPLRPAT